MRSLYVVEDIKKGEKISENNVKSIRPGFGIHPKYLEYILGKVVDKNLKKGDRFSLDNIIK
jgi:pseudaminic acid synthase